MEDISNNKIAPINVIAYKYNSINNEWEPLNNEKRISSYYFDIILPKEFNTNCNDKNDIYYLPSNIPYNKVLFYKEIEKKQSKIFPYPAVVIFNKLIETTLITVEKFFPSKIFLEKGNSYFCLLRTEYLTPILGFQFTSSILLERFITQFEKNLSFLKTNQLFSSFLTKNQTNNIYSNNSFNDESPILHDIKIPLQNNDTNYNIIISIIKNNQSNNKSTSSNLNQEYNGKSLFQYPSNYGTIMASSTLSNHKTIEFFVLMLSKDLDYYKNIPLSIFPIQKIFLASKILYNKKEWTGLPLFEKNELFLEVNPLEEIQLEKYLQPYKLLYKFWNQYIYQNNHLINNIIYFSLKLTSTKLLNNISKIFNALNKQLWIFHHEVFHFIMYRIKNLNNFIDYNNYFSLFKQNILKNPYLLEIISKILLNNSNSNNKTQNIKNLKDDYTINIIKENIIYISNFKSFKNLWYSYLPAKFQYHQNHESNINNTITSIQSLSNGIILKLCIYINIYN